MEQRLDMKVIYIDKNFTLSVQPEKDIVATVGFFDGVHVGHRYLIEQLKDSAKKSGLASAIITFRNHPRIVLDKTYTPLLLNSLDEKIYQLSGTGIDYCFVMDFTKEISKINSRNFIEENLHKILHVRKLFVGYDNRFGKDDDGDFRKYETYGKECGMDIILGQQYKESNIHISSTNIRNMLNRGRVKEASELLGYNYSLKGIVVKGDQIGRTIGFPTTNLEPYEKNKIVPVEGVYSSRVLRKGQAYPAMTYIGKRPTVSSEGELRIESNIFNFDKDIYGEEIIVVFLDFIRNDEHFLSLEELKKQLSKDREDCKKLLHLQ